MVTFSIMLSWLFTINSVDVNGHSEWIWCEMFHRGDLFTVVMNETRHCIFYKKISILLTVNLHVSSVCWYFARRPACTPPLSMSLVLGQNFSWNNVSGIRQHIHIQMQMHIQMFIFSIFFVLVVRCTFFFFILLCFIVLLFLTLYWKCPTCGNNKSLSYLIHNLFINL